jgi:hypothetical protein
MDNPDNWWQKSPQTWNSHGLEWRFDYNPIAVKRTITATGFTLEVPLAAPGKFPSPQAWLEAWAKKNKKRLPNENQEEAVTLELDLFSPAPPTPAVQVEVVTEELTVEEERDRLLLERQVERAFYEAGKALAQLRERRLYRSTHKTFEQYCQDRFGFGRHAANRLITGASVVANLVSIGHQNPSGETRTIGSHILPTTERQVRPLTQLEPEQQRSVWEQAVTEAGGKVPSGRIVKDIVDRIRERTRIPIAYQVGDVCEILVKDNPDLRGMGGCWCIIAEVREFSCVVRAWNGEYTVREENLRDLGYSATEKEEMRKLSKRLVAVQSLMSQDAARAILSALGKLKRPYLTALESQLLEVLSRDVADSPSGKNIARDRAI